MDLLKDIIVPLFLLALGIIGKLLVKRKWDDEVAFMGPDLILAAIGAEIAHSIDKAEIFFFNGAASPSELRTAGRQLAFAGAFIILALGLYMLILKISQWFQPEVQPSRPKRVFMLGFAMNFVGLATMAIQLYLLRKF